MTTYIIVFKCNPCELKKVWTYDTVKTDFTALQKAVMEQMDYARKHDSHSGYVTSFRINEPSDMDTILKEIASYTVEHKEELDGAAAAAPA